LHLERLEVACTQTIEPVERTVDFRLAEAGAQELFAQYVLIRLRLRFQVLLRICFKQVHEHV